MVVWRIGEHTTKLNLSGEKCICYNVASVSKFEMLFVSRII